MSGRRLRGFTLIELLIAMAIAVLLLVLAMPGYTLWVADSQIRNAAESVASGLRSAQATAITRNRSAQFVLNNAAAPTAWDVVMVDTPAVSLQTGSFLEGSKDAKVQGYDAATSLATTVAFNALGQVIDNATNIVQVDVTFPTISGTRPLRVRVGAGLNGVKLCEPAITDATDPKFCPP